MTKDSTINEQRNALAVSATNDGLWDWDLETNKIFYSEQWKQMLGYHDPETISDSPQEWFKRLHPDDLDKFKFSLEKYFNEHRKDYKAEYRLMNSHGDYLWMLCRGRAIWNKDGKATRFIGLQTDISLTKKREQQLYYDAFHDALTGLSNRASFMDRLNQALHGRSNFAVLYMDLDHFKQINDSLGHITGDKILVTVARRLEKCSRGGDTVARLGGDEFAILLMNVVSLNKVKNIANRILKEITLPILIDQKEINETITIGIAVGNSQNYRHAEEIMRDADLALYKGKKSKRAGYEIFNEEMRKLTVSYLQLETDLKRDALKRKILFYYQPIIDIKSNKIVGLEALLRWEHERYGTLKPESFLEIATENQLVVNLEKRALELAHKQFKKLQQYIIKKKIFISLNISEQQLRGKNYIRNLEKILKFTTIDPSLFHLEIPESVLINDPNYMKGLLTTIKKLGFKLSLDDFGTGYSSLTQLHHYPFDFLKLDCSFIAELEEDPQKLKLLKNIIQVAKSLKIAVIAEGVESESTLKILQKLHCNYAQGFYFSQPLPGEKIIAMLEKNVFPMNHA